MTCSRIGKLALVIQIWAFSGCVAAPFRVLYQRNGTTELQVTPDRILLECEYLSDADEKGLYGFMMHVLDAENTVVTIAQSNTVDRKGCEDRQKNIRKILAAGTKIYIAGVGDLNDVGEISSRGYEYAGKGIFKNSGHSLGFLAIANESGLCYDAYGGFQAKPCPPEPFPFWSKK